MLQELNIVNNKVLKGKIDLDLALKLAEQAEQAYENAKQRSAGYPETSKVYLFRTPLSLDNPQSGPGYQYQVPETDEYNQYLTIAKEEVANFLGEEFDAADKWFLLQNNESWIDNPVHQHLTSIWTVVCYVKLNKGDGIEFSDDAGNTEVLYPEVGDFYVFPSSAKHRPIKTTANGNRISLNMEFGKLRNPTLTVPEQTRMDICNSCDRLNSMKICKECLCFMPFKVKIPIVSCPIGKW
jgi:hypothetical protein